MSLRNKMQNGSWRRIGARIRPVGLALLLILLPLAAWAHDDDEKPVPLDPATQRAQLLTFGVVGGLVLAVAVFYYVRRWQLMRSDKFQEGFERDED